VSNVSQCADGHREVYVLTIGTRASPFVDLLADPLVAVLVLSRSDMARVSRSRSDLSNDVVVLAAESAAIFSSAFWRRSRVMAGSGCYSFPVQVKLGIRGSRCEM
jgi:hypothetical protein